MFSVEELVELGRCAFIAWDLQVGLAGKASNSAAVVERVSAAAQTARRAGVPVIWSRHTLPPVDQMDDAMLYTLARRQGVQTRGEVVDFMRPGSPERSFVDGLGPVGDDVEIEKYTPSFFVGTPLDLRLRGLGTKTVVLAGVATDIGIVFTARHALALGYTVVALADAVGSYTEARNAMGLQILESICEVSESERVMEIWRGR